MTDYTDRELRMMRESNEAADILAELLGYTKDPEYGYAVGDHTVVTLAMEARRYAVTRKQVRAVLEGVYEDARGAITAPVHHALMQSAARLERLLGISPAGSDAAFKLVGDVK